MMHFNGLIAKDWHNSLLGLLRRLLVENKLLAVCFVIYLILKIQDFTWSAGHEFLYGLLLSSVWLTMLILLFRVKLPGLKKLLLVIGYIVLMQGIDRLHLWTFSARAYLRDHKDAFGETATLLSHQYNGRTITRELVADSNSLAFSPRDRQMLLTLFDSTAVLEIDVTNRNVLFTFDRFIDNGYGLLYLANPGPRSNASPSDNSYYQVPYEITNRILLTDDWYYIAFT